RPEHVGPGDDEREDIEDHRSSDDEGYEAEISPELAQCRGKAPETRVGSPAHVAAFVVHADERSTRRTDHRSGCFTAKHQRPSYSDRGVQLKGPYAVISRAAFFGRMLPARIRFRRRMLDGVTSTSSSSLMNSIACSRPSLRGGTRR